MMPRISVYCRPSLERWVCRGFTLLELLVVLALVALVTGLVAPAVLRGLESARERGLAADVRTLLQGLPVRAFQSGNGLEIDAAALRRLVPDLPGDWHLEVDPPLRYGPTGVAAGGAVRLVAPGRDAMAWQVTAVSGEVVALSGRGPLR